ncbi:Gmad2 immunoglobulin-like domain-containing protein [Kribbella sp. NBC_01245]|uniref:Gmad2 immunoglobulin-like domain-containing protein n=1 Tax=Kribbella sp. NBC_01245 TaxID=2903578 RepID=UPI002E27D8F0|nr:Gmad2 immunoglobulin-like domain-containing protein [Kribbella sp. NBC_01245]
MSDDEESLDDVIRVSLWREAEFGEQPRQGLEAIQARIRAGEEPDEARHRPWLRTTIGAAVIGTAATIGLFTMLPGAVQQSGVVVPVPEAAGASVRGESQPSRGVSKPVAKFSVYWLGYQPGSKTPRLYRTVESFTGLAAVQAVRRLTGKVPDPDYFSGWTGAKVSSVSETNGVIVVDFASLPNTSQTPRASQTSQASGDDWLSDAAMQQLVYTVQSAFAQQLPVRITLQGKALGIRSGALDSKALPAAKILAPVWITSPTENATIAAAGSVKITGLAMTFEGNVTYRIWNTRTGKTVDRNAAMVLSGDDPATLRPFEFTTRLPPGDYLIECTEYSAHDGALTTRDTKSFTVR